ncbi:MAG TPA: cytochrome P450 [Porticoccaceae bacterium]|nr:cytochrome P450 [Porticoccaceae bacterium]
METGALNLFDPALKQAPLVAFHRLATTPPFVQPVFGVDSLVMGRFRDVETGYVDYQRFSSAKPRIPGQEGIDYFKGKPIISFVDPPEHTRLRRNLAASMSPAAIRALGDDLARRLDDALDGLYGDREAMGTFAHPLAVDVVLGDLLGLPAEDFSLFEDLTREMCDLGKLGPGESHPASYDAAWERAQGYLENIIAGAHGGIAGNRIIATLVAMNRADAALDSEELLLQLMPLCVAGISPIASMLGSVLHMLARHPDQFAVLKARPELVDNALEEILRFDPPSVFSPRYARGDFHYGGVDVRDGMPVYLMVGAIGFDPTVYSEPLRFDVSRPIPPHVIFAKGPHSCLGMHLVRLLGRLLLKRLATRYHSLELCNPGGIVRHGGSPQARDPEAIFLRLARR